MSNLEGRAREWIAVHTAEFEPLATRANLAAWEAATTGTDAALQRSTEARAAVRRLYSDPAAAAQVKELLSGDGLTDPLLRRQLVLLDLRYTENQLPQHTIDDLTLREAELERIFYTFRPDFDGKPASNNELLEVLRTEHDGGRRRSAWEASKRVAQEAAEPLRELVRRRNAAARGLGFASYHAMQLALEEIDEAALFRLLDEFRAASDAPFAALREEIDLSLARRFGVDPGELRPWHWEDFFAQEAPSSPELDLDGLFAEADLEAIARDYLTRIGLPVGDVLTRSDLYERPGKDQHAFCTDIDRHGDVRVLCNLRTNERWMGTLLHELGHAAYDKFLPPTLPYLLRSAAHTFVTEAIAMYLGRLTRDPAWLRDTVKPELEEAEAREIRRQLRRSMLVSGRWILVMAYFERELYRDPDRSDLNGLWWELVESIQRVRRPDGRDEPDWAAKLHLSLAPVYYHNYLLGELMASQLGAAIQRELPTGTGPVGNPGVGSFFRSRIFDRGASLPWPELVVEATGEPLSSRCFLSDFISDPAAP